MSSNSVTPAQVLAGLNLIGSANISSASTILTGSTAAGGSTSPLVGIQLAALGEIMNSEVGSTIANAYAVSQPPTTSGAQGQSGWTVGVTQLDLNSNSAAATLLENALSQSGSPFSPTQAQQITNAYVAAGTSETVNLPSGVTQALVNSALKSVAAESVINTNADTSVLSVLSNVNSIVGGLTAPSIKAALTPGSSTFDPVAYLALADYGNQYGPLTANGPMVALLNGGTATFPGGDTITISGGTATTNLSAAIQVGELATKYAAPSGVQNTAATTALLTRMTNQDSVGAAFANANGLKVDLGSAVATCTNGQLLGINQASGSVTSTDSLNVAPLKSSSIEVTNLRQVATTNVGYSSSGVANSTAFQTSLLNGLIETTSLVDYGSGAGNTPSFSVDVQGDPTVDMGPTGTAYLTGLNIAVNTGGSGDNLVESANTAVTVDCPFADALLNGSNASISDDDSGGTSGNITVEGNNDTVTSSGDTIQLSGSLSSNINGASDTIDDSTTSGTKDTIYLSGTSDTINGQSGDLLAMAAGSSATVSGSSQTIDLNGSGDTITTTGSGDAVDDYASSEVVGGTASTIGLENTTGNQLLTATGTSDNIFAYGSNDTLTGTSENFTFSSGSEALYLNGSSDTITGQSGDLLAMAAASSATVAGNGQTIDLNGNSDTVTTSGSGDAVDDFGNSESVGGTASTISLENNSGDQALDVTNAGDNINVYGSGDTFTGTSDVLTLSSGSETLYLYGATDMIRGQAGDTVDFGAYSSATVTGNNETVNLNAYGDNATIDGSGDTVQDFNTAEVVGGTGTSTIYLDGSGNQALNATSSGDDITIYGASNGDSITASSDTVNDRGASETVAGNAVNIGLDGSSGQVLNATGTGDTIGENSSGDTLNGSSENVDLLGGTSTTQFQSLTIDGNSDNITTASYDNVTLNGNDTLIANGQGDAVNDTGVNDTVGGNGVSIGLDASNEYLNATGTGDGIGENGSNDTANGTGESIYLSGGTSTSQKQTLTVDGSDDNTYAAQNNTISITGGSDTASLGSGDVVFFTGNQTQVRSDSYTGVVGDEAMFNDQSTNTSELQTVDPTSSSYKGYYDYSAQNGSGKLEDSTIDNTNGTSDTTWYTPSSGVTQETEYFALADDHGLETNTSFDTSGGNIYDDSFVYSGNKEIDYYQTVDNSKGTELAEDEFNSSGQEVAAIYGSGNYGGYDPSYTGGYGYDPGSYSSSSAASGADISALAAKGAAKADTSPSSMYSLKFHPLFVKPSTATAPAINTKPSSAILSQAATIEVAAQARIAVMIQAMASFGTSSASLQTSIQTSLAELHQPVLAAALHTH